MRQRTLSLILFFSVVLSSLLSSGEAINWMCDGRVCSTAAVCCCVTPDQQHFQCNLKVPGSRNASLCKSGCACQLIVTSSAPQLTSLPSQPLISSSISTLPTLASFSYLVPTVSKEGLLPIEARGPPQGSASLLVPSLRAPPIA